MATFNELAVLIAEPLGRTLDVSFREQLKERIRYWRSRLLKNTLDKKPADRTFFTQPLTLPMEEVDAAQCGIALDCKVMRSKIKVPTPVRANSILFDYIGSAEGSTPFKILTRWKMFYALRDKYAPKVTDFVAYEDGYIIAPYNPLLSFIRIEYIADNPESVATLNCASSEEDCGFEDEEYPIPGEIAQLIVQSILEIDFQRKANQPEEVDVANERPKDD